MLHPEPADQQQQQSYPRPDDARPVDQPSINPGSAQQPEHAPAKFRLKKGIISYINKIKYMPMHFIKKSETKFVIIIVYVDDLNLVETHEELTRPTKYL